MNKQKNFLKRLEDALPLSLAFIMPVLVMLLVFISREIYPFGDRSFLRTDLYHQYAPFFQEMRDKLQNGESLFYSWDIGAGTNFIGLFAYYLASPFNWLLFLCPQAYVIEFITYLTVFKIGLCGLAFAYYLKKHTRTNHIGIAFFATFYALSGYMAAYSWNTMWLDCLVLFPLIMLGLERLVYEDKCVLYCISLALCVITNYYISIMVCLTLIIYFIALLFIAPTHRSEIVRKDEQTLIKRTFYMNYPKKILMFAFYSFLAAGISLVLLYPEFCALKLTASADSTFPKTFTSYFSMIEMVSRHLVNVDIHLGLEHWPNIYCGVAILMFIPLYVMNKKVNYREKAANLILILFFLASFSMNFLNFIWHGFHYPNSLPCRQSFAYVFLLLVMGYKGFMGIRDRSLKQIVTALWIALGFIVVAEYVNKENDLFHFSVYYVSALFVGLEALLIYMYRKLDKKQSLRTLAMIGVFVVLIEAFTNTTVTSVTTISRPNYVNYDRDYETLTDYAKELEKYDFFRMEKMRLRTKNDGSWYQYPSISVFSSTANANLTSFYKKLGMEASTNAYCSNGATALVNALFNIRYEFSDRTIADNDVTKLVGSSGIIKLYQYQNTLSIGYMIPGDIDELWILGTSPILTQNNFVRDVAGIDATLLRMVSWETKSEQRMTYTAKESGYYHLYLTNSSIDSVKVVIGSGSSVSHTSCKRRYIIDVGYVPAGETVTVTTDGSASLSGNLYRLDADVLKQTVDTLKEGCLQVTSHSATQICGTVNAAQDGTFFTTIPYEEGWIVKVDGQEVKPYAAMDTFLALHLTAGTHTIEMNYVPDGFTFGWQASVASILLFILITIIRILIKKIWGYKYNVFVEEEEINLNDADEDEAEEVLESLITEERPEVIAAEEVKEQTEAEAIFTDSELEQSLAKAVEDTSTEDTENVIVAEDEASDEKITDTAPDTDIEDMKNSDIEDETSI